MKRVFFILITLLLNTSLAMSKEVSFTAEAPSAVVKGNQFRVVYSLNSTQGSDLRVPEFTGCSLLFGPATSTMQSYSYSNGKRESHSTTTYTYTLQAEEEGNYTLPAATVKVGGKQYSSNSLTFKVLPPDKASEAAGEQSKGVAIDKDQLFMRLTLSRTKAYEQQAILATIKLYTRAESIQLERVEFPSFEGFVVQDIEQPQNVSFQLENYNDLNYKTAVLRQYLLFPQRSGKIEIGEGKFDVIVQVPRKIENMRSFFGSSMNMYQEVRKSLTTAKQQVTVEELPFGKPASYMGGVGSFELTSEISATTVKANEAITLKYTLKGNGNLKYMKNPNPEFPNDFEVYDPKVDLNIKPTPAGVVGSRTVEYTIVPRFGGSFTIPSVEYAYFDLASKSYKTLSTPSYTLEVEKGSAEEQGATGGVVRPFTNKEEVELLNSDIRFIHLKGGKLTKKPNYLFGTWGYWICFLIPLLLTIAAIVIYAKQAKANSDIAQMKNRKANKVALKRLKSAGVYLKEHNKEHNKEHFYDEVLRAMWGYLSDKLIIPISQLTKDNVEQELINYGAETELIAQFMEILNTCEFARYAPSQADDAMDRLYQQAVASISKMENRVKESKR